MKSKAPEDRRTIARWIQDLEDGVITPQDHECLMDLMREDGEVRDFYIKHAELSALIHLNAESRMSLGTMPVSIETLRREKRKSAIVSLSYAVAAMLVLGLGLLLFRVSQHFQSPASWVVLEGSADATYAVVRGEEPSQSGKKLQAGDQITLKRGLLKLAFPSGVEAIIEGGSQLELISDSILRMDGGLGWFRVPENAHGFTVRTERGRVIDLGTEFGIRFDGRRDLEVHVAQGLVKVAPALPGTDEAELVTGRAMRFDANGKGQPLDLRASLFRRKFSTQVPHIHWSFDKLVDGAFPAAGNMPEAGGLSLQPRHAAGTAIGPADCLTEGTFGKAFSMKGDGLFAESTFPGICGNAPRTVAAWVRHRGGNPGRETITDPLADPRTGHGASTSFGDQAYLLNYTNSGLTTTQDAIGERLTAGVTYTLSFHAASIPESTPAEYWVELVAFEPSEDDASRAESRDVDKPGVVLATANGLVTTNDMSATGRITFTARADDPNLGKEIGIRLVKASEPMLYDNLRLTTRRAAEREKVVFTESFESPVVTGYAEQTLPSRSWIGARRMDNKGYGAARHGLFSQRPVFSAPYLACAGPGPAISWAAFMLPTQPLRWSVTDGQACFIDSPQDTPIVRNQWTHVATVHTGRTNDDGQPEILHFIDGVPVTSESPHAPATRSTHAVESATTTLLIGALPGIRPGDPTLDGDVDELHIFRAALSEKEVLSLMESNQPFFYRK